MSGTRVLVVSSYPPRHCGIGAYAAAQVERLREAGDRVVVLSPPDGAGDIRAPFVGGGAFRRAASIGGAFDRIVVHYETGLYFRPRSPHTHLLTAASLLWLALRRPRLEIVVHEARTPPALPRPDYALLRLAFARATLLFHSRAELTAFERAYRVRARATLLDHRDAVAVHATLTRAQARARLGIGGGPVFVCAGFLQPAKGFDRAIAAFEAAGSPGHLYVVGSVRDATEDNLRYAAGLRATADRAANVTMLERYVADEDFDAWVAAADRVVLPYRGAWSSGALARAQLLGTPAFVSAVGGLAEQASEDDRVFASDEELVELFRSASGSIRPVERAAYHVMSVAAKYPALAVPLARLRGEGELVDPRTDLLIESFPRCASSFALAAFNLAQRPRTYRVAHQTHAAGHVIRAVRLHVPSLVLIRRPEDALVSNMIRHPARTVADLLRGYLRFYAPLLPHRDGFVVGTFEEVVGGRMDDVIRRVNEHFGTAFVGFEATEENVRTCLREIDEHWRGRRGGGEQLERIVPRPSALREQMKAELHERYARTAPDHLRERAERVFAVLAAHTRARTS